MTESQIISRVLPQSSVSDIVKDGNDQLWLLYPFIKIILWYMHGLCMVCARSMHRACMVYAWRVRIKLGYSRRF